MHWGKETGLRLLDCIFLSVLFLFQNIILNFYLIRHYNKSSYPFLWFLGDFFCLLSFTLTLYLAAVHHDKLKKRNRANSNSLSFSHSSANGHCGIGNADIVAEGGGGSGLVSQPYRPSSRTSANSSLTSEYNWPNNLACFNEMSQLPCAYISWIFYSIILIAKLVTLFKSEIPQHLAKEDFLGPQMIKLVIGLSALIFTLLVEAHKDSHDEPLRNAFVNSVSYGIALEILDSASFLSLLIGSESGLLYTYKFENFIIALSSLNLMLPAIALYKLCASDFGRTYSVPLETLYKVLHLVLVNGSYLGVRIYLWSMFHTDTSIFIIKNIYSIFSFFREIPQDLNKLSAICRLSFHNSGGRNNKMDTAGHTPIKLIPVLVKGGKSTRYHEHEHDENGVPTAAADFNPINKPYEEQNGSGGGSVNSRNKTERAVTSEEEGASTSIALK